MLRFVPWLHLSLRRLSAAPAMAALALGLLIGWGGALPAAAQCAQDNSCGFDICRSGVTAVPSSLWGDLEPTEISGFPAGDRLPNGRDATAFNEFSQRYWNRNWFIGAQARDGYVFHGLAHGLSIWQPTSAGVPQMVSKVPWDSFPEQAHGESNKWPILAMSMPEGRSDVATLVGLGSMGLTVIDTSVKASPVITYQDHGFDGADVQALQVNGHAYAAVSTSSSVRLYDLEAALKCGTSVTCSGPFLTSLSHFSSPVGGTGRWLAVGSQTASFFGLTLYDLTTLPGTPTRRLEIDTAPNVVQDLAMWTAGSKTYLAVRTSTKLDVYDATCLSGSCSSLPKIASVGGLFDYGAQLLTLSQDAGRTYLFSGTNNRCGWNSSRQPVQQMEYLFDVTNPSAPFDLTPPAKMVDGALTGYWGWYYRRNPNGYNYIAPMSGVVLDGQLHRAAFALYDVHRLTGGQPPTASFSHTSPIYAGFPATFTDISGGNVESRSWSFGAGATPAQSSAAAPAVTYATPGPRQVVLTVGNSVGDDSEIKDVDVLDPAPAVSKITVSPAAPVVCQPVTLTATATGKPPLTFSWSVSDGQTEVDSGGGNPFEFQTTGRAAGSYTATVTVTGVGSFDLPKTFTLAALPNDGVLPQDGFTAPTNDAFVAGTVQFHAPAVPAATNWTWDFGDGTVIESSDPVDGPNPVHTYDDIGSYNVTVQVGNCVSQVTPTSAPLVVEIDQIAPLVAGFQIDLQHCSGGIACVVDVGEAIGFNDASSGDPDTWSYDWDNTTTACGAGNSFEDAGHTSPVSSHTFNGAGVVHPCLKVARGAETQFHLHSPQIVVSPASPPSISIGGPTSGTVGQARSFTASAQNCTATANGWSWTVAGGSVSGASNGATIAVSWSTAGVKTLRASNSACGSASDTHSISISGGGGGGGDDGGGDGGGGGQASAAFTAPVTGQAGQAVTFNASASTGSIVAYSWRFGDGTTGTGQVVSHTYAQAGTYVVSLTVAPSGCLSPGCMDTTSRSIAITAGDGEPPPPPPGEVVAAFSVAPGNPNAGQAVSFDASTSTGPIVVYSWDFGDGTLGNGQTTSHTFAQPGSYPVSLTVAPAGCLSPGCMESTTTVVVVGSGPVVGVNGCTGELADDLDKLCLGEGRYIVEVDWQNHHAAPGDPSSAGPGQMRRLDGSETTGFFWFFNPDSIDLIVKIIDGTVVNEHVWVFFGSLSDVIYQLRITDTLTDQTKTYVNPAGQVCGDSDTAAFSTAGLSLPATAAGSSLSADEPAWLDAAATEEEVLHLLDGRFRVTVEWENQHVAPGDPQRTGVGHSRTGTDGTGYFWFFEQSSLDLVVKMIDARSFGGHFWVFYGSLTDVEYTLTIEDLFTGDTWTRVKPADTWCGGSDTAAFPPAD